MRHLLHEIRHHPLLWLLALAGIVLPACAQDSGGFYRPLPLAPADASSSGDGGAGAEDEKAKAAELARKTLNPIADLISAPFQNNWDFGIGPSDAMRYTLNFQPVIPISLTKDWNLIRFFVNTESTYDWQGRQWTMPLNFMMNQMVKVGKQPISLQLGYRYYAVAPSGGPDWGLRFTVTFLFPK